MKNKILVCIVAVLLAPITWAQSTNLPTHTTTFALMQDPITTPATCFETANGKATLFIQGGEPISSERPFQVLLTRNNTSISSYTLTFTTHTDYIEATLSNLPQGTYIGTLQDKDGSSINLQFSILSPEALTASITNKTDVTCYEGNNGSIQCLVNGGTTPYQIAVYTDMNNPDSQVNVNTTSTNNQITIPNLSANHYYINVTDANGCSIWLEESITQPAQALQYQPYANSINCSGQTSGKVFGEATGGTLPYTYQLTGVNVEYNIITPTGVFENLAMGVYQAKVTDANGCVASPAELITITESETLTVDPLTQLPAATVVCKEDKTASVTFTVAGRVQPVAPSDTARYYSIKLFDITNQQELIAPNLTYSNRFHPVLTQEREEEEPLLDTNGQPILDANGNPTTQTVVYTDTLWNEGCHEPTKVAEVLKVSKIDYTEDLKGFDCDDKITVSGLGAGAYSIQFYQDDCQFGKTMTFTVEVTGSLPQVQINDVSNFCDGSAYTVQPNIVATPATTQYVWTLDGVEIGTTKNLNRTFTHAENGQLLQLTATNQCGSSTSNQEKITVRKRPTAVLSTNKGFLCQNQSAQLNIAFKGTAPFNYELPNQEAQNTTQATVSQQVTPLETTTYTLATLSDAYCQANIEQDIENTRIVVYPEPDYTMQVDIPDPMVSGRYVTVTATEGFKAYYLQVNGENISATEQPNQFKTKKFVYGTSHNEFALQLEDTNGCHWELKETHSITSETFPNIFTPNGDGVNDILLEGYNIRVFDRHGNLVFMGEQGWDGTINGQPANQGVYLYVVEITDANGQPFTHKLTLTLER